MKLSLRKHGINSLTRNVINSLGNKNLWRFSLRKHGRNPLGMKKESLREIHENFMDETWNKSIGMNKEPLKVIDENFSE